MLHALSRTAALPSAGDTWGLSGPEFLLLYIPLGVVAVIVGSVLRWRVLKDQDETVPDRLSPTELAALSGNPRTVLTGLAYLRGHGLIDSAGTPIRPRSPAEQPPAFDRFACMLHDSLSGPVARRRFGIRNALAAQHNWLLDRGYLPDSGLRKKVRRTAVPVWLVVIVGVLRAFDGSRGGKPIGFLVFVLFVLVIVGLLLSKAPAVTARGRAALNGDRDRHGYLDPKNHPSFGSYGPASVALAVALFGVTAVRSIDPALVATTQMLGFSVSTSSGGSGGGDSGGGGGDGGGCGG
ncbi:TIGR04222 domain-containing membrane protein [Nocardia sp. BMG51109]|uniref:TIGR04222 domain-containing membrane protein n=1 Tax=Nocardia sp. BMG51109 TaxID=1056816 RepID=UPI0004652E44|nr:TIGR04222 domain-containing membrane protein [Nocardia sp. BMG51109]